MSDVDPSKFFDLSDFDLRDNDGLVSNEQIDAEEQDARRKVATPAEPLPPGFGHLEHFPNGLGWEAFPTIPACD